MSKKIITFQSHLDNPYYLANDNKKELYLYIDLKAGLAPQKNERVPLNIALIIDRSGSMRGDKLTYVKKATDFVIDNLNANDHLAIVQYDDTVDVVSATHTVTNKKKLHNKVANIKAGGTTNLSGGMLEGFSQVAVSKRENIVNRVLLLSDGLANEGITDPSKLQQIAQKKFREQGIALSTFGVGADFNESLMTNLAEYGGANYYFIDTPDQIPNIFAKELEGLLSVVAQNAKLSLHFASQSLKCTKVYGYPASIGHDKVEVSFNDIFSEEQKAVLIKFEVTQPIAESLDFNLDFTYDDAAEILDRVQEKTTLTVKVTSDKALYENSVQPLTAQNIALFEANDLYETAMSQVDDRQYDKAKTLIERAMAIVETALKLFPTSEELKEQLHQLKAYYSKIDEMKNWSREETLFAQKTSKAMNYNLRKKR